MHRSVPRGAFPGGQTADRVFVRPRHLQISRAEASNDETVSKLALALGALGNVRTET